MDRPGLTEVRNPEAYEEIGRTYGATRRADPRILRRIAKAVGGAASVVNIGAGTGSYEPPNRRVVAVEPSETMIAQRRPGAAPAVKAVAEKLPFKDSAYAAAMAILTIHHWSDPLAGLREMRRVARRRAVVLTLDPAKIGDFWLYRYFPDAEWLDSVRFPSIDKVVLALGGDARVETMPITHDCRDGFLGAFWRRPSAYLRPVFGATSPRSRRSATTSCSTACPGSPRTSDRARGSATTPGCSTWRRSTWATAWSSPSTRGTPPVARLASGRWRCS